MTDACPNMLESDFALPIFAELVGRRADENLMETSVPVPLILQIQEAALDSKSSVTDALRKAKVACTKLALTEFENWVDLELGGYIDKPVKTLPEYRKLRGVPMAYSPYGGWQPIIFKSAKQLENLSFAPIQMTIFAIETSLVNTTASGTFHFPYPTTLQQKLMESLNWGPSDITIELAISQIATIIDAVRNILLNWTIEMEKQGILGNDLLFNEQEREKSAEVTAHTVSNIHIGQVGSFVQNANQSVVQGGIGTTLNLEGVKDLLQQVEQLLPASNLPAPIQEQTHGALDELKAEASSPKPDRTRLRRGLESLKHVLAPAGEHLLRIAVDSAVTKLLPPGA